MEDKFIMQRKVLSVEFLNEEYQTKLTMVNELNKSYNWLTIATPALIPLLEDNDTVGILTRYQQVNLFDVSNEEEDLLINDGIYKLKYINRHSCDGNTDFTYVFVRPWCDECDE